MELTQVIKSEVIKGRSVTVLVNLTLGFPVFDIVKANIIKSLILMKLMDIIGPEP